MISTKWLVNTLVTAALGAAITLGADSVAKGRIEPALTQAAGFVSTAVDGLMHSAVAADAALSTQLNAQTQAQGSPIVAYTELSDSADASAAVLSDTNAETGSAAGGATSAQIIIGGEASSSSQVEAATTTTVGAESSGSVSVQAGNVGLRLKKLVKGLTVSLGLELEGQTEAELTK